MGLSKDVAEFFAMPDVDLLELANTNSPRLRCDTSVGMEHTGGLLLPAEVRPRSVVPIAAVRAGSVLIRSLVVDGSEAGEFVETVVRLDQPNGAAT